MKYPPVENVHVFVEKGLLSRSKPSAKYDTLLNTPTPMSAVVNAAELGSKTVQVAAKKQQPKVIDNPLLDDSSSLNTTSQDFAKSNTSSKHSLFGSKKAPKPLPGFGTSPPKAAIATKPKQVVKPVLPEVQALITKEAKLGAQLEKLIDV